MGIPVNATGITVNGPFLRGNNKITREAVWALPPRTQPRRRYVEAPREDLRCDRVGGAREPTLASPRDGCRARPLDLTRRGGVRRPTRASSRDHQRWGASTAAAPFAVASLAAAAAAATGYVAAARDPVRADAASQTRKPKAAVGSLPYDRAQSVADWLLAKGATLPGVHIRPVDAGRAHVEEHGMGLYASKDVHALEPASSSSSSSGGGGFFGAGRAQAGPVTLASVPLALALTSKACVEHEAVGECFRSLMDDDVIDERMAVMLLLILERRRGARSPAAPYVEAIPARFRTPLHYSDDESRGLAGTNLHDAASQQRKTLDVVLRERVRPAGARLFRGDAGVGTGAARVVRSDLRRRVHELGEDLRRRIQVGVLGVLVARALVADGR